MVEDLNQSFMAVIGQSLSPGSLRPLDWATGRQPWLRSLAWLRRKTLLPPSASCCGFAEVAEDGWLSTGIMLRSSMSLACPAYSFLVFNLLCAPCFAAIGAIKREMNNTTLDPDCGRLPDRLCLCGFAVYLSVRHPAHRRRLRNRHHRSCGCGCRLPVAPDPPGPPEEKGCQGHWQSGCS